MPKFSVDTSDLGHGLVQYTAYESNWVAPVGMAWVLGTSGEKEVAVIYDCYVPISRRRDGVMRAILDKMFERYEVVISDGVTTEGVGFMRHMGFKYRKETGDYYKEKK